MECCNKKNKNWIKSTCLRLYRCISEVLLHRKQNNSYLQYLQLRRAITIVVFLQSKAAFPLGARLLYSLGTNVNTPLLQAPKQEFGHGVSTRVQKSGTGVPVCTPLWLVPGQSIALLSLLSSCFKMTSDMAKVEKLCTQLHIGYSNCEHNTSAAAQALVAGNQVGTVPNLAKDENDWGNLLVASALANQ